MLTGLLKKIKPEDMTYRLIRIDPSNLRAISVHAINEVKRPSVMLDSEIVKDYSERGPLRRKRIAEAVDFEIRDGSHPVMGFHGGPSEMWISHRYAEIAEFCEKQGWLTIKK